MSREHTVHVHSGQTTGHSREHAQDLSTSGQFPSSSHKIPRSTSATRAISVLSSIILPLQTFFSRVLLLRQQPFSSENLPPRETNDNYRDKNTSLHVSLRKRKFDKICRHFVAACFYGNGAIHSHARARGVSMRTHLTAVELWNNQFPETKIFGLPASQRMRGLVLTKRHVGPGNEIG